MIKLLQYLILPCLCWATPAFAQTLYMIGDSTMANKTNDVYPETGWGQVLARFAGHKITIENHAVNGRSSKSFIDEGRWDKVKSSLAKGDFLIIQFGHNDQKIKDPSRYTRPKVEYKANLQRFIDESRAAGAYPILATPISRRKFTKAGELVDTHGEYPQVVRDLAKTANVPLVDMQRSTEELLNMYGETASKRLFLHAAAGELENYPDGVEDNTHLSEVGALKLADIFVTRLNTINTPLNDYFDSTKTVQVFSD